MNLAISNSNNFFKNVPKFAHITPNYVKKYQYCKSLLHKSLELEGGWFVLFLQCFGQIFLPNWNGHVSLVHGPLRFSVRILE